MSKKLTEKVSFDLIRYANCWEDADILLQGLAPHPNSKILSIGSAGDNSFSLLTTDPEIVVAIDISRIQLYLIELKKVAIQYLEYHELLCFLGFREGKDRERCFNGIKDHLSAGAYHYWEAHIDQIKKGIITQGKFERYFQLFSHRVLPFIHSKRTTEALLKTKTVNEQQQFYQREWNNRRWRLLFRLFFSRYIMGKYGRDPQFMKEVKVPVGTHLYHKAGEHLQRIAAQDNFILRYNLTGSFGTLLPHYLQPGNFQKIKTNLHKLYIRQGYAEDAIKEYGKFHYMNLSNIFEYMNMELFTQTADQLVSAMEPGGRLVYWNLMVPRKLSTAFPDRVIYEEAVSLQLSKTDKGFFYNQFIVDRVL